MTDELVLQNLVPITEWTNIDPLDLSDSPQRLLTVNDQCRMVHLTADPSNVGTVYIGASNVNSSNASIILSAGESQPIAIDGLNKVYVFSSEASGDKLRITKVIR